MSFLSFEDVLKIIEILLTLVGFTIGYLVFVLQAKTFQGQQEITKIEQNKYLLEIRPEFTIDQNEIYSTFDDSRNYLVTFILKKKHSK